MDKLNLVIFCSGYGSNLMAVYNAIKSGVLQANISLVVLNTDCNAKKFCDENNINYHLKVWDNKTETREEYDTKLIQYVNRLNCPVDLVLLLGWNHIVTDILIKNFQNIINLHPALPNTFVGQNCIEKAYQAYQRGEITHTGSMVHRVIRDVDKGEVLNKIVVPINSTDSLEDLETRVKMYEKGLVISVIQDFIIKKNNTIVNELTNRVYVGKVRSVEELGYNVLLLDASNRISAFDKHLCNIPNKGLILNKTSKFWFEKTRHIIPNHYLHSDGSYMFVKKAQPIKLEIVVRAYMTGSSATSIWTYYKQGERNIYGINFRDGYSKNEVLDDIIITPTTKGITDKPITREEIINENYLTPEQCDYIFAKAKELFVFGQDYARSKNLILVDTKYEFGFYNNEIILIDEVHTCDSSRYWLLETYQDKFNSGNEPEKLDKDAIRDWVKKQCDPYKDQIPEIPNDVKTIVINAYNKFYTMLTSESLELSTLDYTLTTKDSVMNDFFENKLNNIVVIIAGSVSDKYHVEKIMKCLKDYNIYSIEHYCSAHKETKRLMGILDKYNGYRNRNIVYVTCAGMSNALSGVVSCNTNYPNIACPVYKDKDDMNTNINSTLQCPSKCSVMAILSPQNVAISIRRIFDLC